MIVTSLQILTFLGIIEHCETTRRTKAEMVNSYEIQEFYETN